MTRLSESIARATAILEQADLSSDEVVHQILEETHPRRSLDLTDLTPAEQARLIASRTVHVLSSVEDLADAIDRTRSAGSGLVVKFGIDPTGADVHLGHAVPMILISRFQRMGHRVALVIGDVTAKIGDPSGRVLERPALTEGHISGNLRTYAQQMSPLFAFAHAEFHRNSEWLSAITLPCVAAT
jgi:tyrosyl-tRNA synthetase